MKKHLFWLTVFIIIIGISFNDCLSADTIYFSCPGRGIYKYDSDGNGSLIYSFSGTIMGLTFDTNGNLYASLYYQKKIIKIDPSGAVTTFASNVPNTAYLAYRDDSLYTTVNTNQGSIEKFDLEGNRSTYASGLVGPTGLAFDDAGNLFVSCWDENAIKKIGLDGNISTFATGITAPEGLTFDKNGNLYAARSTYPNGFIYKFDSDGNRTTFAYGGMPCPTGLAFDSNGYLYECNRIANGTINKIDPFGNSTVFASGLYGPSAIAIIPEPATLLLLGLGGLVSRRACARRSR